MNKNVHHDEKHNTILYVINNKWMRKQNQSDLAFLKNNRLFKQQIC